MKNPDLYDILGVPRDASAKDIKAAYRARAKASHPDKGGSEDELKAINLAWEALGGPVARRRYDETGETASAGEAASPGESMFLKALDYELAEVLSEDDYSACRRTGVLDGVRSRLRTRRRNVADELGSTQRGLDRMRRLTGRHPLVARDAGGRPVEGENLVESRLRAVMAQLAASCEAMQADLLALDDALFYCDRYTRPEMPAAAGEGCVEAALRRAGVIGAAREEDGRKGGGERW